MSCDVTKWECLFCTYLNWQSAIKCTMCRSPKPLEVIEEGAPPIISSIAVEDSEPVAPAKVFFGSSQFEGSPEIICPEPQGACRLSPNASRSAQIKQLSNKLRESRSFGASDRWAEFEKQGGYMSSDKLNWTCPSCSSQNWINSSSCKECNTRCEDGNQKCYGDSLKIQQTLRISDLTESGNDSYNSESEKRITNCTPTLSPSRVSSTFPRGAEKYSSRSGSPANSENANQVKWACSVCTYSNWPRSVKCVMCESPRPNDQDSGKIDARQDTADVGSVISPALATLNLGVSNSRRPNFDNESQVNSHFSDSMRMRFFRGSEMDRRWLEACSGAVDGNIQAVEEYLTCGGDPTRQLTESEVIMLDRPSAFDIGFTLIHLALRFHQEDVLATLLSQVDGDQPIVKRVPSNTAPNIALEIRRHVMSTIRPRKGTLRCHFTTEITTFTLPSEIEELPPETQETLFDEVLDRDVQKELENGQIINWSLEVSEQLNSRLYALWNRSAGDCLLDSILQATWGIFDRDNGMRRALSDSLHDCATQFYQRWKESELLHARHLNFSLNEAQCSTDWAKLLSLASQPGSSLEQLHIFTLAHILRRPIIVYGVKYVKSFRGEAIGFARFEGVYLPFLWESSFCWRWPIALGYTRGHFSALVPMEPDCDPLARADAGARAEDINERSVYLPLTTIEGAMLPIQFLTQSEIGKEEYILRQWLDISFTEGGIMVARQRIQKRPLLVAQMVEEWLNHYRRLGQISASSYMRQSTTTCYSSEGESDND